MQNSQMSSTDRRWQTPASGITGNNAPIPLSFSIPANFTQSTDSINLVDQYIAQVKMNPPLIIPNNCCIDLIQTSVAYTQPNVAPATAGLVSIPTGNNRVSVNFGGGGYVLASELVIPTGLYSYSDIEQQWNLFAIAAGWVPPTASSQQLFIFTGISATQQLVISIDPLALAGGVVPAGGIILNFTNPSPYSGLDDSIGELLGFTTSTILTVTAGTTTVTSFTSPLAADFAQTSAYAIYMSLVSSSYQNGLQGQLLAVIPLGQFQANSVISWQAALRYPVPAISGNFSSVQIWTTDQAGNKLPLRYYQSPLQFSCVISKNKGDGSL